MLINRNDKAAAEAYSRALRYEPENIENWWKYANLMLYSGNLNETMAAFTKMKQITEELVARDKTNMDWQYALSLSYEGIGYVLKAKGELKSALKMFIESMAIGQRIAAQGPVTLWISTFASSRLQIGDILLAQGDFLMAFKTFDTGYTIATNLVARDTLNSDWQWLLILYSERIGDALYTESLQQPTIFTDASNNTYIGTKSAIFGLRSQSLKSFKSGLKVAEKLSASDISKIEWQREVTIINSRIAKILIDQGDFNGALQAYQQNENLRKKLAAQDTTNIEWQRDLSIHYGNLGNVQRILGDFSKALKNTRLSLIIAERLALHDTSNAQLQLDQTICYFNLSLFINQGVSKEEAIYGLKKAIFITNMFEDKGQFTVEQKAFSMKLRAKFTELIACK